MLDDRYKVSNLEKLFSGNIEFIYGSNKAGDLPEEKLFEIAIVGKSNVGKSSFINSFTGRRQLARVSNTPGRTRQINFFDIGSTFYLVDLPGYGYAKVSKSIKNNWEETIIYYLEGRKTLGLVILLVDGRHGFKDHDVAVLTMLNSLNLNYWIVFTKSDKLPKKDFEKLRVQAKNICNNEFAEIFFISNFTKDGVKAFREQFWRHFVDVNQVS